MTASQLASVAFAIAILVFLLGAHLWRQEGGGRPWPNRFLACYMLAYSLQQFFLSIQLQLEDVSLGAYRIMVMLIANPVIYLFFDSLRKPDYAGPTLKDTWHLLPLVLFVIVVSGQLKQMYDLLLSASLLAYAGWFIFLLTKGRDQFSHLGGYARAAQNWLIFFALFFVASAVLDLVIAMQVSKTGAIPKSLLLQIVAMSILVSVGYITFGAMGRKPWFAWLQEMSLGQTTLRSYEPVEGLRERIEREIQKPENYQDGNLTIARFARRIGIPVRQVSQTINQELNCSFSQLLNKTRIDAAKRLLVKSPGERISVLNIAYEVGFGSKSNFNKEFKRQTGKPPTEFRRTASPGR